MAKSANQKSKLLYLMKIFYEKTDENHQLTVAEIIKHLEKYDISAERKSIYSDIEALTSFGLDIEKSVSKTHKYYLASRDFDLAELKLLVDSVQASRFITKKKSAILIKKLETLASSFDANQLQRQVYISDRIKNINESIYYNVDNIHCAIAHNHQIQFKYFKYDVNKERIFQRDGQVYQVSPFALCWDNQNYYLIAFDSKSNMIKHYRVDKMVNINLIEDCPREGTEQFSNQDLAEYTQKFFGMFGGQSLSVKLKCQNQMSDIIIDRFGDDIILCPCGLDHFTFTVDVIISPQFYCWIFGLGNRIEILSPTEAVDGMRNMILEVQSNYKTCDC